MDKTKNLLEVRNLTVHYETDEGICEAVNDISFDIHPGEILGVVGETGAGKTTIALSIMGLLPKPPAHVISGSIKIEGNEMLSEKPEAKGFFDFARKKARKRDEKRLESIYRTIRGKKVSMMFQDPMTALNPVFRIGEQVDEITKLHNPDMSKEQVKARTIEMLKLVGIANSEGVYKMYPHELSGGMRQRVCIAIGLACNPRLIIADEPTTALDVTIQAQILDLMRNLKDKINSSIMLITHDLGVIAEMADYVVVMYAGRVVEKGTASEIFKNPSHPYTIGLMRSKPVVGKKVDKLYSIPGKVPNPIDMPDYCYFRDRCELSCDKCQGSYPGVIKLSPTHEVSCYRYADRPEAGWLANVHPGEGGKTHE